MRYHEYHFRPMPEELTTELADLALKAVGKMGTMDIPPFEGCTAGEATIYQKGADYEVCVTIYAKDKYRFACAHANGIAPDSELDELCRQLIEAGYGDGHMPKIVHDDPEEWLT